MRYWPFRLTPLAQSTTGIFLVLWFSLALSGSVLRSSISKWFRQAVPMRQEFNTSATRRRRCAADCFRAPGPVDFRWLNESGWCNEDENMWCTMTSDTLLHITTLYDTHVQLPSTKSNQPRRSWSKVKTNQWSKWCLKPVLAQDHRDETFCTWLRGSWYQR